MKFTVAYNEKGLADGIYEVIAPGFSRAVISWADETGALRHWCCFAVLPLDQLGKGVFEFRGRRAIPPEASYIEFKLIHSVEPKEEIHLLKIPENQKNSQMQEGIKISSMSDLHLSSKINDILHAFQRAMESDYVMLAGDLTNDGFETEFERLKYCLISVLLEQKIFAVIGNHDMPKIPTEQVNRYAAGNYLRFQEWLMDRVGDYEKGPDGSYAVILDNFEVIGLQAVADPRRFVFEEKRQLLWLDEHLSKTEDLSWHIVLCHAPLVHHNPKRAYDSDKPYLGSDKALQSIIDCHKNIVFISGHTHLTLNDPSGCIEWDKEHQNLYINDGTIRRTDMVKGEPLQPAEWRSGTVLQIVLTEKEIEINTVSVYSGKKHARGYYRIKKDR